MSLEYVHEQPCGCVNCEGVREKAYTGPGLYKAISAHRKADDSGTTTWTTERFVWGEKVPAGTLVYVERELETGEKGAHLKGVVIWIVDGDPARFERKSKLCTSKRWLEPA